MGRISSEERHRLLEALNDPDPEERRHAVWELTWARPPTKRVLRALRSRLRDRSQTVRDYPAQALAWFEDREALDEFIGALDRIHRSSRTRGEAYGAAYLAAHGTPEEHERVVAALERLKPRTRGAALTQVDFLLSQLREPMKRAHESERH